MEELQARKMDDAEIKDLVAEEREASVTQYLQRHHKFELLDSVLTAFLETNTYRGSHYTLPELLNTPHKRFFLFYHYSIPYLATVFPVDGATATWVNIKLCNDGFAYKPREGTPIARHQSTNWVALPIPTFSPYVHTIHATFSSTHKQIRAFYNFPMSRLDLKLYPRDPTGTHILITFEPGYPYVDEEMPAGGLGE